MQTLITCDVSLFKNFLVCVTRELHDTTAALSLESSFLTKWNTKTHACVIGARL